MAEYVQIPKKQFRALWIVQLAFLALIVGSYQYANYVDRQSNQYFCNLAKISDNGYRLAPPATPTGKLLAEGFSKAVNSKICK